MTKESYMFYFSMEQYKAYLWVLCCSFLILCFACQEERTDKRLSVSLSKAWELESPVEGSIYPISFEGNILISSFEKQSNCITSYQKSDGGLNWKWCDTSSVQPPLYYNLIPYLYNAILVLPNGNNLYALDVENGKLKWKNKKYDSAENVVFGIKDKAYRTYYDGSIGAGRIVEIELQTGKIKSICTVQAKPNAKLFLKAPFVSKDENGNEIIVCGIVHYNPADRLTQNLIGTWSLKDGVPLSEIEITRENFQGRAIGKPPLISGDLSYWLLHDTLVCFNNRFGRVNWKTGLKNNMITSMPFVKDDFIYYAGEGDKLIVLNRFKGTIHCDADITGTPSRIYYANEHVFLIGGVDGALYTIKSKSGEVVRRMKSDSHNLKKGTFFQRNLYVDEKIILLNDTKKWTCYTF